MLKAIKLVLVALAVALPLSSHSQNGDTYRAGLKNFTIPAPSSDLVEAGPDYRVLVEPIVPVNNRLIAAFVQPTDLDSLRSGHAPSLSLYALVEVPRRAEFSDVNADDFKQIADSMATQFNSGVDVTVKDQQDELNRRMKALNSSSAPISLDKPIQLGTLFCKPNACAYGLIMAVSSGGSSKKMAMGVILLRAQARVLFLYTYADYKGESTVQSIRTTDEHWADAILAANQ